MLDTRIDSIIYQSQIYYRDLVNELTEEKKLGKAYDCEWQKADLILAYLESLNYVDRLTDEDDRTNVTYILECLINLCELNQYPVPASITFQEPPAVIVGVAGSTGATGNTGATGATGLATDIQVSLISVPTVTDSFTLASAKGARWDYIVIKSTGEQRAGQVIGTWLDDGSALEIFDTSTDDITGSTDALTFSVEYLAPNIRLIATPASGIWNIVATRYFIPNNGNGSGPISDVLPDGQVYIGNASNTATARTLSGAITTTNTGVTSLGSGVIVNANISASAGIVMSKLEALTASRVAVTDGSGIVTTSSITTTKLGYLTDVTSNIQAQLDSKLSSVTGAISTVTSLDLTANRVTVSSALGKIAASGITTTELNQLSGVVAGVTSSASGTARLITKVLPLGFWNMDSTASITVAHGVVDFTKIRSIHVTILNDGETGTTSGFWTDGSAGTVALYTSTDSTLITINRIAGGLYDSTTFDRADLNRGWVTITYEA
jgi:hypothetical protein